MTSSQCFNNWVTTAQHTSGPAFSGDSDWCSSVRTLPLLQLSSAMMQIPFLGGHCPGPQRHSEPSVLITLESESHKLWHEKSSICLHLPTSLSLSLSLSPLPLPLSLKSGWGRARKLTTCCHLPPQWLPLQSLSPGSDS